MTDSWPDWRTTTLNLIRSMFDIKWAMHGWGLPAAAGSGAGGARPGCLPGVRSTFFAARVPLCLLLFLFSFSLLSVSSCLSCAGRLPHACLFHGCSPFYSRGHWIWQRGFIKKMVPRKISKIVFTVFHGGYNRPYLCLCANKTRLRRQCRS